MDLEGGSVHLNLGGTALEDQTVLRRRHGADPARVVLAAAALPIVVVIFIFIVIFTVFIFIIVIMAVVSVTGLPPTEVAAFIFVLVIVDQHQGSVCSGGRSRVRETNEGAGTTREGSENATGCDRCQKQDAQVFHDGLLGFVV
jgi:hypothetical protein